MKIHSQLCVSWHYEHAILSLMCPHRMTRQLRCQHDQAVREKFLYNLTAWVAKDREKFHMKFHFHKSVLGYSIDKNLTYVVGADVSTHHTRLGCCIYSDMAQVVSFISKVDPCQSVDSSRCIPIILFHGLSVDMGNNGDNLWNTCRD